MTARVYKFEDGTPAQCPPDDATPYTGTIFRGIRRPSHGIQDADFLSHRTNGTNCDAEECICWGLSVWVTQADFEHARKNIPPLNRWALAAVSVDDPDGLIKKTPSNVQPNHHTFWKEQSVDWKPKAVIVVGPRR